MTKGIEFLAEYDVDLSALSPDARKAAERLGEEGVANLVKEAEGKKRWRGRFISNDEALTRVGNVNRLQEQGGGHWDRRRDRKIGDTPSDWLDKEMNDLIGE